VCERIVGGEETFFPLTKFQLESLVAILLNP
jgi:hypothetical protein